jgi:hypothetical protein
LIRIAAALLIAALAQPALARTIGVGPDREAATLPQAARLAEDGDTVRIAPGIYAEGAVWTADRLRIEAEPGTVAVTRGTVEGKALFVIRGDDVVVSGIRFEGAAVPDGNGAGIRSEGRNLRVEACDFTGNENGILIGPPRRGNVVSILKSRFADNGSLRPGGIGHEIYAGTGIDGLVVEGSRFESNHVGHYVKSRALSTVVRGNVIDDTDGSASYLIDIPQGGAALIENNELIRGPNPSNCCVAIAYGFEMEQGPAFQNPPGEVVVRGNRYYDKGTGIAAFFVNRSTPENDASVYGNSIGRRIPVRGFLFPAALTAGAVAGGFGLRRLRATRPPR